MPGERSSQCERGIVACYFAICHSSPLSSFLVVLLFSPFSPSLSDEEEERRRRSRGEEKSTWEESQGRGGELRPDVTGEKSDGMSGLVQAFSPLFSRSLLAAATSGACLLPASCLFMDPSSVPELYTVCIGGKPLGREREGSCCHSLFLCGNERMSSRSQS